MSTSAAKHIETLQFYKDYADSTATLNQSLNREIKDCYGQIDNLRLEIKRIEHENSMKTSKAQFEHVDSARLSQSEGQLHVLSQELHQAKIHILSLETQLECEQSASNSRMRMIQQKEDEADQLKRTCRELQTRVWESEHKCETINLELQRQTSLSASYQEMLEKRITQISEMQRQAQLQIQGDVAMGLQESLQQADFLRAENQQLRENMKGLEELLGKSQQDYEWLKRRLNEKGETQDGFLKQISSATEQRKQLQYQLKRSEEELLQRMRENDQLRLQLTQAQVDLREKDNRLRDQFAKSASLEEEIRQYKRNRLLLEDEITHLKQAKANQIEELNSKIEHMNSMLVEERRSLDNKSASEQASNLLSIVSETSFQSQREADKLREEVARLNHELQFKNQILREFEDRVDKLTHRLEELNASKLESAANLELKEELARTRARLEIAQSAAREVSELRLENNKLLSMIEILNSENAQLKRKLATMEADAQLRASHPTKGEIGSFGGLPSGSLSHSRSELQQLQKEYSETLLQSNLLKEENIRLETKRLELSRDLEEIRMELTHHANSFDQLKDLKARLREAYDQMDHMNRFLAERDIELNLRQANVRSPQRQARVPPRVNPEKEWRRSKSPVQRLLSPGERAQQLSSNHNGYWLEIQNKIKALKSENELLRKNLSSGVLPRK